MKISITRWLYTLIFVLFSRPALSSPEIFINEIKTNHYYDKSFTNKSVKGSIDWFEQFTQETSPSCTDVSGCSLAIGMEYNHLFYPRYGFIYIPFQSTWHDAYQLWLERFGNSMDFNYNEKINLLSNNACITLAIYTGKNKVDNAYNRWVTVPGTQCVLPIAGDEK